MIRVRFHAGARDLAGTRAAELPDVADLAALRGLLAERFPELGPYLPRMRFAVDDEFARDDTPLAAGATVDLLPPVAGGSPTRVCLADIRDTSLSIDECYAAVQHPAAGGVCVFVGVVRDHAPDAKGEVRDVARLEYEAHETMAPKELRRVLEDVAAEFEGARLACTHRIGDLRIGDLAVVVVASAPHRAEAFEACRRAIDTLKERVPIWKREHGTDGSTEWVNL